MTSFPDLGLKYHILWDFSGCASGKEPTCQCRDVRDTGSIPGLKRSPGGGYGNPLQYSCLENPMDRGAWQATIHSVAKSWAQLKRLSTHAPYTVHWLFFTSPVCDLHKSFDICTMCLISISYVTKFWGRLKQV